MSSVQRGSTVLLWSNVSSVCREVPLYSGGSYLPVAMTCFQVLSDGDPLGELLTEIPEPTEEMVKSDPACLTLDLIQGSRDSIGLSADLLGAVGVVFTVSY